MKQKAYWIIQRLKKRKEEKNKEKAAKQKEKNVKRKKSAGKK